MDFEENQRKEKQQYLFSEIIEGGFDATLFQEFLEKKKPNGYLASSLNPQKFKNRWDQCRCMDFC